jgi:molybdopterin molybdotransferase
MSDELDVHAAVAALVAQLIPVTACERVPLAEASARILARDLIATQDLPHFANAAMDGYAVRAADCETHPALTIAGSAFAGHGYEGGMTPGTTVRIMTGAPLPAGADAVVMQEDARREGDQVAFSIAVRPGLNVRPRGQQARAGDVVVAARTQFHASEIGMATAVGVTQVEVLRRLHVGLASTGDELVDPPVPLTHPGGYDANRPMLAAACRSAGFLVTDFGICRDRAADFAALLDNAGQRNVDAFLISGGTALGDADVVRKAEGVHFVALNIRPGRGITFAQIARPSGRFALLGLPGNAVSTFVMFHLIALPALLHLAGATVREPVHLPLPLADDLQCKPGVVEYLRGRLEAGSGGQLVVRPLSQQGAGMVRTLVDADVLIAAGPQPRYAAGAPIPVVLLSTLPR